MVAIIIPLGSVPALPPESVWTRSKQSGRGAHSRWKWPCPSVTWGQSPAEFQAQLSKQLARWPIMGPQFLPQFPRLLNQRAHSIHGFQTLVSKPEARPLPSSKSKFIQFYRLCCSHFRCVKWPVFLSWNDCDIDNSNCFSGMLISKVRNDRP